MEYVALAIAVAALIVSFFSLFEARRQNRITQDPILVGNERESGTEYIYEITNKGHGAAYFISVDSFLNLERLENGALKERVRERLRKSGIRCKARFTTFGQESVMSPGETIEIVRLEIHPEDAEKMKQIDNSEFGIRIKYRSAHGHIKVWASDDRLKNE